MANGANRTNDLLALISSTAPLIITTAILNPSEKPSHNVERVDASYASTVALTLGVFFATAVYAAIVALCTVIALRAHMRQREERDKLGAILAQHAWPHEAQADRAIRVIRSLSATEMFRGITGYHVLAYKYRFDGAGATTNGATTNGAAPHIRTRLMRSSMSSTVDVFQTLRKIEKLFDSISLALPCQGKCPMHIRDSVGTTVSSLAQSTACLWSDQRSFMIQRLVHYFSGRRAARSFSTSGISDASLRDMVNSKIPYVDQLMLCSDRFVLKDIELAAVDPPRMDIRCKIRYIDMVLSRDLRTLTLLNVKSLTESYGAARDICFTYRLVHSKSHHPDIILPARHSDPADIATLTECVVQVRHLLRLMCSNINIRSIEADDNFFQFIMKLHEILYGWADEDLVMEAVDRSRSNIVARLNGITAEQVLANQEFTKTLLEQIEKDLYSHLHYLTTRQVDEKKKGKQRLGFSEPREYLGEPSGVERIVGQLSGSRVERGGPLTKQGTIDTSASDISVYTSAVALHGGGQKRRERRAADEQYLLRSSGSGLQHTISTAGNDQGSILSGSSLYATAASLSSGSDHGAGGSGTVQWGGGSGGAGGGAEGGSWGAGELGIPSVHYDAKSAAHELRGARGMASDGEEEFLESPV